MPTPSALIVDTIIDETGTGVSVFEGEHTASEVAIAIGEAVGLPVSWQTDDYTLWDGFDASGDPAEKAIRDLAKPMMLERRAGASVFEPFATDVYMAGGGVLLVKKRQGLTATPEYTLTAENLGAVTISIVKVRLPIWGKVTLVGKSSSNAIQITPPGSGGNNPSTPPGEQAGDQGQVISGTTVTLSSFSETKNIKNGEITQTFVHRNVLMPDNLPQQITTEKFLSNKLGSGMILASTKLETWDYLHPGYDNKGPKAHAKLLQKTVQITSRVNQTNTQQGELRVTSLDWTGYALDERGHVRMEGTYRFKLDAKSTSATVNDQTPSTITWHTTQNDDVGLGYTSVTKDEYTFVKAGTTTPPGADSTFSHWEHTGNSHNITGGKAPGGPQPGAHAKVAIPTINTTPGGFQVIPTNTNLTGGSTLTNNTTGRGVTRVTLQEVISGDPSAQVYSYSNPNLELAQLQRIMNQMRLSSGLYHYEVKVEGPDAAFLRRGQYVQITGARTPTGEAITLDPMIIVSMDRKYNEKLALSTMIMVGRFWRETDTMIDTGVVGGNQ